MLKIVHITTPNLIATDFMWCVTGKGGIFTFKIDDIPDYTDSWDRLRIVNDSSINCFIRASINRSEDIYIENGCTKEVLLSDLRGY